MFNNRINRGSRAAEEAAEAQTANREPVEIRTHPKPGRACDLASRVDEAIRSQAEFAAGLSFADLPPEALHAAKRVLLDSIGCMAAGSRLAGTKLNGGGISPWNEGAYTVVGRSVKADRVWAALLNGSHMVAAELDEGNQFAKGHPAAHFLPALLAEADRVNPSGEAFLAAMVAAYEVAVRWGGAVTLHPRVHTHGNWGTAAAATAVAKLRGGSPAELRASILLAASLPLPSAWAAAFAGATVRDGYIGISNALGLLAPGMAQYGIAGSDSVVASVYGELIGTAIDPSFLQRQLGTEFFIAKNYMKTYACCRYVHGAIDALLELRSEAEAEGGRGLDPETVDHIRVDTYQAASALADPEPPNGLAAKFSIPCSLAILLAKGSVDASQFTAEAVADEEVRRLARRIEVAEDPALTALLPEVRATRVTLTLKDGRRQVREIRAATGEYTNPLTDGELEAKFYELAEPVWGERRCAGIVDAVANLERTAQCSEWIGLLS